MDNFFRQNQDDLLSLFSLPELPKFAKMFNRIKYEGIYSFGGISGDPNSKYSPNHINNDLRFMEIGSKEIEWKVLEVSGKPPEPRYLHSMDHFENSNMIVIFGGRMESSNSSSNYCLNDVWILHLSKLSWSQLK
jgi:hypothetical protein